MAARRIAHLSDLHLLSAVSSVVRARLVGLGRALNPRLRIDRAVAALRRARDLVADHVVLSGDLTELGQQSEFEALAEVLASSGFSADQITLVPGNHDRYGAALGWLLALKGPLRLWARNTPSGPDSMIDLGNLRLLPLDVTRPQSLMRSAGFVTDAIAERVKRTLHDSSHRAGPVVIVQHHPPFALSPFWHRIDGLIGCERLSVLTERHDAVQVLHGHLHRHADRGGSERVPRVLGAAAIVGGAQAVRFYDVTSDGLTPFDAVPRPLLP